MEILILYKYLEYRKEKTNGIWMNLNKLPPSIFVLFFIAMSCAITSLIMYFTIKISLYSYIPLVIELISTVLMGYKVEKVNIHAHNDKFNEYLKYCDGFYKKLSENSIKTKEQILEILNRINNRINKTQCIRNKWVEMINKWMQILFIPVILILLKAYIDSKISTEYASVFIFLTLIVYATLLAFINIINFDVIIKQKQMQYFAEDLQGVIDVKFNFIKDNADDNQ